MIKYGYNNIDWDEETVMSNYRSGDGLIMYYEDEEAMAILLKAYNDERDEIDDDDEYGDTIPITKGEVINNVVSQLSKMQTEIIDGTTKVVSLDSDEILIDDGELGTEFGELTKTGVLSRLTAVKYLSGLIYKCMRIIEFYDFTEIKDVCNDIRNFQHDLEDGENNTAVNQMVCDLKEIM